MISVSSKTLQDLEFSTIIATVKELCETELGMQLAENLAPIGSKEQLLNVLQCTNEYLSSFSNNNALPSHAFEHILHELKFLKIENSFLELNGFRRIHHLVATSIQMIRFLKKFQEYYPTLFMNVEGLPLQKDILEKIDAVIDKFGEIKNTASPNLSLIRSQMSEVRARINQSFVAAMSHYQSQGYLDDIKETVVENRRVLAVLGMYRKKVKGSVLGSSKTGSIAYIEPETTQKYSRELENLRLEEREEIVRILRKLTAEISIYHDVLSDYQEFLASIDFTAAKAKYAYRIKGLLPHITEEKELYFREAFHPILYWTNKQQNKPTYPQTIELRNDSRIIVISGPNAGGKTISLKTVGLLQLMLQSGLLIPVHERSKTFLFDRILTDIGDNQSIENHLSTYSYRLKNMNYFLKKCNAKTLFLIDEFGTGSDPELGGALAETFLEEFYYREAFGIITTHYTNLKMLANELEYAVNANMLFDEKSLEPVYKLQMGQPGSSFTFEVAQKNGIPYSLINRAKKKIEGSKVRFDKTIATLQKERSKLEKTSQKLTEEEQKAREESKRLEVTNQKIREKLESYQELYDANQRLLFLGQKLDEYSEKYFHTKDKKELISQLLKTVEIENSKRKKLTKKEAELKEKKEQKILKEIKSVVEEIRTDKKEQQKKEAAIKSNQPHLPLKVGDRVRMLDGKAVGTIDVIEKNKATVNYGIFTSKVSLTELELVEAIKSKK